ncbi:MAG TPA: DUF5946 family protein [Anaerolineaceae bacterium]
MNPAETEACPMCGARGVGGSAGCQEIMHSVSNRVYSDPALPSDYASYRAAVDCYALQHPEIYCVSAKSYAAHLAGLCCRMEFGGKQEIQSAIQEWLDGPVDMEKPPLLAQRGEVTVLALTGAADPVGFTHIVDRWAESVWEAYAGLQGAAHSYIELALRERQTRGKRAGKP